MGRQGESVEQRDHGVSGRRLAWQDRTVGVLDIVRQRRRRLSTGAEELNLFTVNKVDVIAIVFQQRTNGRHR